MEKHPTTHPSLLYQDQEGLEQDFDVLPSFGPPRLSDDDLFPHQETLHQVLDEVLDTLPSFVVSEAQVQENRSLVIKAQGHTKKIKNFFFVPSLCFAFGASMCIAFMLGGPGIPLGVACFMLAFFILSGVATLAEKLTKAPLTKVLAGSTNRQKERLDLLATLSRMTSSPHYKKKLGQLAQFSDSPRVLDKFWETLNQETASLAREFRSIEVQKQNLRNQDMLEYWAKQDL